MSGKKKKTNRGKRHTGRLELRGKKWLAIWMVNGKRFSQSTGCEDRKDAEAWLRRRLDAYQTLDELRKIKKDESTIRNTMENILGSKLTENERKRMEAESTIHALTVDEAWQAFVNDPNRKDVKPQTLKNTRQRFDKFVEWLKTEHPEITEMRGVTVKVAKDYARHIKELYVPSMYTMSISSLCQVWSHLSDEIHGTTNPWSRDHLNRAGLGGSVRREFTEAELAIIFREAKKAVPPLHQLFTVMLFTGARLSDCALMKWEYVNLQRGFISFVPIKMSRFKEKARVKIPILPPLRAMLESFPPEVRTGYILPDMADEYERGNLNQMITNFFKNKCHIKTAVKTDVGKREHSFKSAHSFRHTFVSMAANAGIPFAVVQKIVGHSTAKMLEHYFHDSEDATMREFEKFPMLAATTAPTGEGAQGEVIDVEATVTTPTRVDELKRILNEIIGGGDADEIAEMRKVITDLV